jgi:hypothetical protein
MRAFGQDIPKPIGRPGQDANTIARLGTKCGWLHKRSDFTRQWKSRFCVVKQSKFLYYYESEEDTLPKGIIDLENYIAVEACPSDKKPFSFKIAGGDGTQRHFLFDPKYDEGQACAGGGSSAEDARDDWVKAILEEKCSRCRSRQESAPRVSEGSLRHIKDIQDAAFEDMGVLDRSLNDERRTVCDIREKLVDMETRLVNQSVASERPFSYSSDDDSIARMSPPSKAVAGARKNRRSVEDEDAVEIAGRVRDMLERCLTRAQQEAQGELS